MRHIAETIENSGIRPESLILEITESVVITDADAATRIFHQLRGLGVQLYMDDFGSGYSSLNSLQQFPLDGLKIDRKFVQNASGRRRDAAVVNAVVNLASHLGLRLVAEGIETAEQLQMLQTMDCDLAQGFYFSVPVEASVATNLIPRKLIRAAVAA